VLAYAVGTLGLGLLPALVSLWGTPAAGRPAATAVSTYRADRRSTVIYGLACTPLGALVGILVLSPAYGSAGWLAGTLVMALGTGACCGLIRGSGYSRLKLTELVLAAGWLEPVGFLRLLEDAADVGVVRRAGAGYEFQDDALRSYLAELGRTAPPGRARGQAGRPTWTGIRFKVTALAQRVSPMRRGEPGTAQRPLLSAVSTGLTKPRIDRIAFDFAAGAAVAVFAGCLLPAGSSGLSLPHEILDSLFLPLVALVVATGACKYLLSSTAAAARWGAVHLPGLSRRARIGAVAVIVAAGAALVAGAGTFLANALAFLLPAAFVAACGLWTCRRVFRRWHAAPGQWLRKVPDVVAAATSAAGLLVAVDRGLLTTQWATLLLFPVAIPGSVRLWIVMQKAERLIVRAGADITLSLLLGGELVLFLVWLANVLGMPRPEVDLIRTGLDSAGSYAGVYDGGRLWAGIYGTLAVASVAFAMHPGRLRPLIKWFDRLRLPQVLAVAQRAVTGVYVGVLTIVFVGVAAPAALTPTLQGQLKAAYVVALQRQLQMEAEISADDEIREEFNELTPPSAVSVLGYLVEEIHHDAQQRPGSDSATGTEKTLAYRIGEDQAAALNLPNPPSAAPVAQAADPAGSGGSAPGAPELANLAATAAAEESAGDQAKEHLKVAFGLALAAVANAVPIPNVSKNEVAQIFTQYITGLVGDDKVTEAFEARLEHLAHRQEPPGAETLVVPDPNKLDDVAQDDLSHEAAAAGVMPFPLDVNSPPLSPSANGAEMDRATIQAAVDAASQEQEIRDTGTCSGCIDIGTDDDGSHGNHDDAPAPDTHFDG